MAAFMRRAAVLCHLELKLATCQDCSSPDQMAKRFLMDTSGLAAGESLVHVGHGSCIY